jgi:ankyrin repeat protein
MRGQRIGGWLVLLLVVASIGATPTTRGLIDAAKAGDGSTVRSLLQRHVDVNVADVDGSTALHWAVYRDDRETAELLIRSGANVRAVNRYGVTPLALACTTGNSAIVEKLLKAGAEANAAVAGEPVLMTAARAGNLDVVKMLAANGADVNAKETWRGQTALMWAAAEQHPAMVELLIGLGANVRALSTGGDVQIEMVSAARKRAVGGFSALLFAARQGDLASTRLLLDAGADTNDKASDGNNALLIAINNLHYDVAALLVQRGADPNATDRLGFTPLHLAVRSETLIAYGEAVRRPTSKMDRLTLIKTLLAQGASVNARTALEPPRDENSRDGIHDRLIEKSVSLGGATPFFLAARAADIDVMKLLVAHGADPTMATFENTTPLAVAAGVGYFEGLQNPSEPQVLEAVRLTVELGNKIDVANKHGQTPLHGAVYRGADTVIQFLADRGARLDATDVLGRTPLKLAEEGFYQVNSILRRDHSAMILAKLSGDTPEAARLRRSSSTPK